MHKWNDCHGNRDVWKSRATGASIVLDVSVEEVLVGDIVRVSSWCHVGHQEHFFRWSLDLNFFFTTEYSSTSLDLLLLSWIDIIVDLAKLKRHRFSCIIDSTWSNSCLILVLKNIIGEMSTLLECHLLDYLEFNLGNMEL